MNDKKDVRPFSERHPKWNFFFGLVILLVLLGLAGIFLNYFLLYLKIGIDRAINYLSSVVSKLDAVIIVALITGTVSIVGVVLSSIVSKVLEYKQKRREYLYQKREEPYSEFIEMVYKVQESTKQGKPYSDDEMITDMYKFSQKLTLWGSNRVIKKWLKFREYSSNQPDGNNQNIVFIMEDIMYAMRKDMGLKKLRKGDLLAFFVNDIRSLKG